MLNSQVLSGGSSSSTPARYFRVSTSDVGDDNGNGNNPNDGLQSPLILTTNDEESPPRGVPPSPQSDDRRLSPFLRSMDAILHQLYLAWMLIFPYIRRGGNLLFGITILTMLIVVPMVTYTAIEEHRFDFAAFDSAGVMVLGTVVLSLRLVYLHLTHWYMPQVQKYVVRIVWMVPLYAVQSWLSLRFRDARLYIDAIRDLYEAFVIASFLYYLIELLGGQDSLVRTLLSKTDSHPQLGKHSWPLNLVLTDWELGTEFMLQCKHGVLQYVVVKTAATMLTYIFEMIGCYGEGEFKWNMAYPYLAFLLNCSVMYALYVLVMLFHAVHEELKHPVNWSPLGKFLCVKGVVFFTWWQGVIIFYLKSKDIIKDTGSWSGDEICNALIDYCICTEMVFFAIAHSYTFTYKEYLPSSIPPELRDLQLNADLNASANVHMAHSNSHHSSSNNNNNSHAAASPHHSTSQPQLRLHAQASSESVGSTHSTPTLKFTNSATYNPPAVLDRPLDFKEAFWSSSIPKETIDDIQQLRKGVDSKLRSGVGKFVRLGGDATTKSGDICLQEIQSSDANTSVEAVVAAGDSTAAASSSAIAAAAVVASTNPDDTMAVAVSVAAAPAPDSIEPLLKTSDDNTDVEAQETSESSKPPPSSDS